MRTTFVILLVVACVMSSLVVAARAQSAASSPAVEPSGAIDANGENATPADGQGENRFTAVDVYVDSGDEPLAAYQFELTATAGEFRIVGVEGGSHIAFAEPPYYDPAALMQDRIIIASFNTGDDLPTGRTRIARIHVQIVGNQEPTFVVELDVAASADGSALKVNTDLQRGATP